MKNLTTSTVIVFLLFMVISFFLGRYSVSMENTNLPKQKTTKEATSKENIASNSKKDARSKEAEEKKEAAIKLAKEAAKEKANNPPASSGELARTKMGISDKKIGEVLSAIAENLEYKRLSYRSELMQDCSGIFHQMKDSLQKRLPSLAESGGAFQYPSSGSVRSSRQIADWYYKNKNLLLVQDAIASRNSIRPGSVLFYGKSNKTFKNITIDLLTDRDNNYTSNGAIMHIAVVTAITTDPEGNVTDYTIMHGRNSRNHASRTGSKAVQSSRTPNLPPFGNWSQQLVAIANIATPAS